MQPGENRGKYFGGRPLPADAQMDVQCDGNPWDRRERCETCYYWDCDLPQVDGRTGCKRYPPMLPIEHGWFNEWPSTTCNEWCGEWRARPEVV